MPRRQVRNQPESGRRSELESIHITPTTGSIEVQGGGVILRNPDILEGKPYLADTRMGVHAIVGYWQTYGGDVDRILREFPHLSRAQIDAALAFYRQDDSHRTEIDDILGRNRAAPADGLAHQRASGDRLGG